MLAVRGGRSTREGTAPHGGKPIPIPIEIPYPDRDGRVGVGCRYMNRGLHSACYVTYEPDELRCQAEDALIFFHPLPVPPLPPFFPLPPPPPLPPSHLSRRECRVAVLSGHLGAGGDDPTIWRNPTPSIWTSVRFDAVTAYLGA